MSQRIAVIGGGIAGLSAALALQHLGFRPTVFEAAPEVKPLGAGLLLAANAMRGLTYLGVADQVVPRGHQLSHFAILGHRGQVLNQADSTELTRKYGLGNFAIHRADLHKALLAALSETAFQTNRRAVSLVQDADTVTITFQDGTQHTADYVLVADGVYSALRQQLVPNSAPRYAGYTCWRAVIKNPGLQLSKGTETWGPAGRIGIVPLCDDRIYWFLCINAPQHSTAMQQMTVEALHARFSNYHTPIPAILAATRNEHLLWNDIIDIAPLRQLAFGRVLLLGDAGHATTPNMGQGACQAIEDAAVLLHLWRKQPHETPQAIFQAFSQLRLPRTTMIVNRSWTMGKIAQYTHPWAVGLRNAAMRMLPASLNEKQLAAIYQTDF